MPELNFADTIAELKARITSLEAYIGVVDVPTAGDFDHGDLSGLTPNDDHPQYLRKDGGTMTGNIILANMPVAPMEAATKLYVDQWSMLLPIVMVPDLRSLWLAGNYDGVNVYGHAGQGRTLLVTGALVSGLLSNQVPYLDFDGANDYLSRADEVGLDLTAGFSMAAWVAPHDFDVEMGLFNHWSSGADQRGYLLKIDTTGKATLRISSNGLVGTVVDVTTTGTCTANVWSCIQAYYSPSTALGVRIDDDAWDTNVTSIPAACHNASRAFRIGEADEDSAKRLDGYWAGAWLSGSALSTTAFETIRAAQAPLFA